jgi:hypothetical protein
MATKLKIIEDVADIVPARANPAKWRKWREARFFHFSRAYA